tara:strand:+ start:95 stop:475 length:381 start_codon:yes stop_codon:yes gene_type:complete
MEIGDLNSLRTAPILNELDYKEIKKELKIIMSNADWFTIGIMAPSFENGINVIRAMEQRFGWKKMKIATDISKEGPIYLKANQNSGEIHARIEYGLGKGIIISCHNNDNSVMANTVGPFPLDFFNS